MPYIGKQLVRGQNRKLDDISSGFNGSQTTFTLQVASQNVTVGSALQLWISLGGVIQEPTIDYTIAGNQITFTTAPAASLDFFGVIQGDVTDTNTPGDATVTTSKLSTGLTVNLADGSAATSSLQLGGTDSGLFSSAADKVNVTTGGVERLEIGSSEVVFNDPSNDVDFRVESNGNAAMLFVDGGNDRIGIGTSSPTSLLEIKGGAATTTITSSTNTANLDITNSTQTTRLGAANNDFAVTHNGSESFRIDSSGRLLVGTSSSTTLANTSTVQISASDSNAGLSILRTASAGGVFQFGAGSSGDNVSSGDALGYIKFTGYHTNGYDEYARITAEADGTTGDGDAPGRLVFSTTADGASSPTERMRIDSSGNVGINASSPGRTLDVDGVIRSDGTSGRFELGGNSSTPSVGCAIHRPANNTMAFVTGTSERARLDSSGRLLVGTSSTRSNFFNDAGNYTPLLQVETTDSSNRFASLIYNTNDSNQAHFIIAKSRGSTNGSHTVVQDDDNLGAISFMGADGSELVEAARISCQVDETPGANDMPGRLTFHTTQDGASSPDEKMRIFHTGQTHHFTTVNGLFVGSSLGAGTTNWLYRGNRNRTSNTAGGVTVFYVYTNGNVQNTNNSYGAISDVKLKENIVDATSQWDDLKALQVRKYNFIEGETHTQLGVIAQEVETVSPGLVNDVADRDEEGNDLGTVTKTVNYSVLYMKAVKALQEAMERIETLEAKVAALEAE